MKYEIRVNGRTIGANKHNLSECVKHYNSEESELQVWQRMGNKKCYREIMRSPAGTIQINSLMGRK